MNFVVPGTHQITTYTSLTDIKLSILARYDNHTNSFHDNTEDSCFNVQVGDRHLWQVNAEDNTEAILVIGGIGFFILSLLCCFALCVSMKRQD